MNNETTLEGDGEATDVPEHAAEVTDEVRKKQLKELRESHKSGREYYDSDEERDANEALASGQLVQYSVSGGLYVPATKSVDTLPPGCYKLSVTQTGLPIYIKHNISIDSLMRLPDSKSEEVIVEIERFWTLKDNFKRLGFQHKRGILMFGLPGCGKCLRKDTPVLMFDGSVKKVQDIRRGDRLMGDDSTARTVGSVTRGREMMYEIIPNKGDSFGANKSHILVLQRKMRDKKGKRWTEVREISIADFLNLAPSVQKRYKLYKTGVQFKDVPTTVDPYFLGVWLGDGTSAGTGITTADPEIKQAVYSTAKSYKLSVRDYDQPNNASSVYTISSGYGGAAGKNRLLTEMQDLDLIGNKHIPAVYKHNSEAVRLALLAGLLDTDGSLTENCFEISQKPEILAGDIAELARSLGFFVSMKPSKKKAQTGVEGVYQRIRITGDTNRIPTRIPRKQATARRQVKDALCTGFQLEKRGVGDYYGFTIDGNGRFLLGDYTVTHNTACAEIILGDLVSRGGLAFLGNASPSTIALALATLREIEPEREVVVIFEDIDELIEQYGQGELLSLLDGEFSISHVAYIATTNYITELEKRVVNRPSRFDRVIEVGMPNEAARKMYLENRLPSLSPEELTEWVKVSKGWSIAHLKELIVATKCFETPFDVAVKRISDMFKDHKEPTGKAESGLGFGVGNDADDDKDGW